ncbi:MAG: 16S rRNA (cytosine(1402)-N(4))-methyltransferase RsmH [Ruminococcaceae bacterium]|nr:16S rRNA (cytosine(1402)-N(4))-methyltransferase RsmH [Oscillospiraceae bacterium]
MDNNTVNTEFRHYSVMLRETVDGLDIKPDGIYVDCTLGGGGHSEEILKRLEALGGNGKLISIDRDPEAIEAAGKRLARFGDRSMICKGNFSEAPSILDGLGIEKIDGVTADLGVSSRQLDESSRGFSYMHDAPLDMRMSKGEGMSAYDVVNSYSEDELKRIIYSYGEEKFSSRIASFIVREREKKPIETTFELSEIIKDAIPAKFRKDGPHPAKRTFQAIRIEVNGELDVIDKVINGLFPYLNSGGRMSFISFHSLEDRIIKHTFLSKTEGCTCPKDFPVCVCGKKPEAVIITKKPILPSEQELDENPRSRSAKLRILEKI